MKKYGLQLRVQSSQQKKHLTKPPLCPPIFSATDDDDVNGEISRQATKKKVRKDVEEQHKKALEEDPTVFDYDGVYDEMKQATVRPRLDDRQEKKSKYIHTLMEKAKERERNHEIVYERKLAKERSKDDHLFADKDKFITSAYKKKLAEQEKWKEEQRLCELREEKDSATKKEDITNFYFNLANNVSFGGKIDQFSLPVKKEEKAITDTSKKEVLPIKAPSDSDKEKDEDQVEAPAQSETVVDSSDVKSVPSSSEQGSIVTQQQLADQSKQDHHKTSEDKLSAAKERFLARKKAKQQ